MNKVKIFLGIAGVSFLGSLVFQNCGQFGIDQSAKFSTLNSTVVFNNPYTDQDNIMTLEDYPPGYEQQFDGGSGMTGGQQGFDNGSGGVGRGPASNVDGGGSGSGGSNQTDNGSAGGNNQADGGGSGNGGSNQTDGGSGNGGNNQTDGGGTGTPPNGTDMTVERPDLYGPGGELAPGAPGLPLEIPEYSLVQDGFITFPENPFLNLPGNNNGDGNGGGAGGGQTGTIGGTPGVPGGGTPGVPGGGTPGGGGMDGGMSGNITFQPRPAFEPVTLADGSVQDQAYKLAINRLCTDWRVSWNDPKTINRTPMVLAKSLELVITSASGEVLCQRMDTANIKNEILFKKEIDFTKCQKNVVTPFKVALFPDGDKNNNLLQRFGRNPKPNQIRAARNFKKGSLKRPVDMIYLENNRVGHINFASFVDQNYYSLCDENASPLFVDLRKPSERDKGFDLTAPWEGILFDIWGERSSPEPHTKKQISWFQDDRMAFVVLPDRYGRISGVNEMFGDSTRGPDGLFANNGFAALAKYDGLKMPENADLQYLEQLWNDVHRSPDGKIDADDDVFGRLKLWKDKNSNGTAEDGELLTMKEAGIEVIDLKFDPNFKEEDQYGNIVKYKSVVKMDSGELNLIFDIWFKAPR